VAMYDLRFASKS